MAWRIAWTVATLIAVETTILAISLAPALALWAYIASLQIAPAVRIALFAVAAGPSYAAFALTLLPASALATRLLGWRTPINAELRIADFEWLLLDWVRFAAVNHVVRILAGQLLRGTPPWTAYMRLSGARIGRRVYVNSLWVSDYNLLEIGDEVVIGADAHIAGHTVERGIVKTAPVKLGPGVTVGVGSIVDIGVTVGADCQIGALSLVPKHSTLEAGGVYAGVPARRIDRPRVRPASARDRARRIS